MESVNLSISVQSSVHLTLKTSFWAGMLRGVFEKRMLENMCMAKDAFLGRRGSWPVGRSMPCLVTERCTVCCFRPPFLEVAGLQ